MPLTPGSRLGPYEILTPLGAGGMGEVYRARDPRLGRDVAIKVVHEAADGGSSEVTGSSERLRRFEQEARAVAALSHPNVLAIFDIGVGDVPFLVTELLEGETLRTLVSRGPVPPQRVIDLALQFVAGLSAAHARGIVHRDLKPENIFVTADGHVKILDFGLAKRLTPLDGEASGTRPETLQGAVVGTIGYMSPEQVRGLDVDARTDLFACGAILFEMLSGQRAFRGATAADTISAILTETPSPRGFSADTPPSLARIVSRCLEKEAGDRFQSARDLGFAIESASDVRPAAPEAATRVQRSSIAVLPFANLSAEPENQYFSDGLSEDLINALARLSGLRVASRTSSFRYRGQDVDVREIGRELGVGAILEGSVRRSGARLRITAQLTDAGDGYHIWSERFDRQMADVFDIQDEIVEAIVTALAPTLVPEVKGFARRATENLEAYVLYLKGRHFWNQRSPAVVSAAIKAFEDAIALDPEYALAYAGLADCYSILRVYGWTPNEHTQPRASSAVSRALELDPDLPEAQFSMALYTFHFERQWRRARRHFLDAIAGSPRTAMFEAYYALFLAAEYAHTDSREHLDRAIALDPQSPVVHFLAASSLVLLGDLDGGERHIARTLELHPENLGVRAPQTVALVYAGRYQEALAVGERVTAVTRAPIYLGVLGMVYGSAGHIADAKRIAQELDERQARGEYIVPLARLTIALGLKDRAAVRAALAACVDGAVAPFAVASACRLLVDGYRDDPEIDRLLDRLNDGARP